jgi:hypothetical protein
MNPDGHYGLQCVDLVDQYVQDIFGVPWPQSIGGVTGAKQLLDAAPDAFWIRTDNDPNHPDLIPSRGDVVVFAGSAINEWGHTAVVDAADASGMWVVQQDGFAAPLIWADGNWYSNKPAHRVWLPYYSNGTGPISGWLTPRTNKLVGNTGTGIDYAGSITPALTPTQRRTGADPVNIRTQANSSSSVIGQIPPNTVQNFVGYVVGEMIAPYNVWYKGESGYVWSGAFTEAKTDGLPNLTPVPPVMAANQRKTGPDVVNIRKEPNSTSAILGQIPPNTIQSFVGYVVGEKIGNYDVWYKGTTGYVWCGAFTTQSMAGLPNVTPKPPVVTPPVTTPTAYSFQKDFDFVEYIPAAINNLNVGNFPDKPEKVVIHQFGTLGVDTLNSTVNTFTNNGLERVASSHFVVSGKRIIQMVSLKDRAYHAGSVGNNYVGIETDPAQDADTIASTKKLLSALKAKYGYELPKTLHKDVPGNSTNCGASIKLSNYDLDPVIVIPTPDPEPKPVERSEEEIIEEFLAWFTANLKQGFLNRKN